MLQQTPPRGKVGGVKCRTASNFPKINIQGRSFEPLLFGLPRGGLRASALASCIRRAIQSVGEDRDFVAKFKGEDVPPLAIGLTLPGKDEPELCLLGHARCAF